MNEAETRAEHIDPALKAAGWGVVEGSRVLREHGITLGRLQGSGGKGGQSIRAQAEIVDDVLVYRKTTLAALEELKRRPAPPKPSAVACRNPATPDHRLVYVYTSARIRALGCPALKDTR